MRAVPLKLIFRAGFSMLLAVLLLTGCQATAQPPESSSPPAQLSPLAAEGKQLFVSKGCGACHRAPNVPEAQGTIGPNLRGIGNQQAHPRIAGVVENTPQNMRRWLQNPQALKPGTSMPGLNLSDDEAAKITAFLETLQ